MSDHDMAVTLKSHHKATKNAKNATDSSIFKSFNHAKNQPIHSYCYFHPPTCYCTPTATNIGHITEAFHPLQPNRNWSDDGTGRMGERRTRHSGQRDRAVPAETEPTDPMTRDQWIGFSKIFGGYETDTLRKN